ncbi:MULTISPECIES: hypothetical protein [unclassified Streptomyces]|uniref:hypothetical protein n=1 Tax=unclassified Streptomyces TaxID=2593676 RepID=UPI0037F5E141
MSSSWTRGPQILGSALLAELGLPAVVIGAPSGEGGAPHPGLSQVRADDAGAMAAVLGRLYGLGTGGSRMSRGRRRPPAPNGASGHCGPRPTGTA